MVDADPVPFPPPFPSRSTVIAAHRFVWARQRCRISPPRFWPSVVRGNWTRVVVFCCILGCLLFLICIEFVFFGTVLFVSISQVIGCEDRLQNDLYCVEWGVKLYSNQQKFVYSRTILYCFPLFPLNQARRFGEHCKLPTLPSEKKREPVA